MLRHQVQDLQIHLCGGAAAGRTRASGQQEGGVAHGVDVGVRALCEQSLDDLHVVVLYSAE